MSQLLLSADGSPTVPEPELYRSIQAVLPRETDQLQQSDCFNKGKNKPEKNLNRLIQNNIRCKRCDSVCLCLQLSPFSCIRLPMSHIMWLFLLWPSLFLFVNFSTQSRYLVKPVSISSKHCVECLAMSAKLWLILLVVINIFWICTGMEKNLTPLVSVFSFLC